MCNDANSDDAKDDGGDVHDACHDDLVMTCKDDARMLMERLSRVHGAYHDEFDEDQHDGASSNNNDVDGVWPKHKWCRNPRGYTSFCAKDRSAMHIRKE